jgi:hypothetical protein
MAEQGFTEAALRGLQTHTDTDAAWAHIVDTPDIIAAFSVGHPTPLKAVVVDGVLSVTKDSDPTLPNPGWAGDGTVPADCAIPHQLTDRRAWRQLPHRHLPMPSARVVVDTLRDFSAHDTSSMRGGDSLGEPWLGVDLEEIYVAGDPVTVSGLLMEVAPGERTSFWVTATHRESKQRHRVKGDRNGSRFTAAFDGLPPGAYHVRVSALHIPRVDDVHCDDMFGVVAL